jgi:cephalosporin-C deacetylase-like acetyl esterase
LFCNVSIGADNKEQNKEQNEPQSQPVLPSLLTKENGYDRNPKLMMTDFLQSEIAAKKTDYLKRYNKLKTIDDITAYQKERRDYILKVIGKTFDRTTPLNPKITKTFQKGESDKNGYKVEMLVFETAPKFYASAAVYIPDEKRFQPPYPAVLVVCGHSKTGKGYERYQQVPALAASNGLLAMTLDPIDQGERSQRLDENGKPKAQSVAAHNVVGAQSIPLGRNAATFEIWDMMRAIDYLQSRSDVIKDKIGTTGTSGGGTQTSYIMALDDRVAVAVPSCYICNLFNLTGGIGPQDAEQNLFGQLAFGLDHADYGIIRAPKPILIETATADFFPSGDAWEAFRNIKRIYDRFELGEQADITETDGEHGWHKNMRQQSIRWFLRWLAGRNEAVFEADDMPITPDKEFLATETGEVMKIDGARSAFDLNRDYNEELLAARKAKNANRSKEELKNTVRIITGIRPLDSIPSCKEKDLKNNALAPIPPVFESLVSKIEQHIFITDNSGNNAVELPAFVFVPKENKGTTTFLLCDKGKNTAIEQTAALLKEGKTVIALDLRGLGETQAVNSAYYRHNQFGTDGCDYYRAYLLGKSYLGMRTEDLLAVAKKFQKEGQKFDIAADGEICGTVAIHAAFLEPALFSSVKLLNPVRSWYEFVKQGDAPYPITNIVHGALLEYDLPDLE